MIRLEGRGGSPANWLADGGGHHRRPVSEFEQMRLALSDTIGYLLKLSMALENVIRQ